VIALNIGEMKRMKIKAQYPTVEHQQVAETISRFFAKFPETEAVLQVGSCARGKASIDSCLDITVLMLPEKLQKKKTMLEQKWSDFYETNSVFEKLRKVGKYSHVDLDFIDGCFTPKPRSWTSGPDEFELEIGNALVYSVPLYERSDYLEHLKSKWLPYYNDDLRRDRLNMVCSYCINNLNHISLYAERGLHFQAFDRLYNAFKEFLQALFISRRTYPIAYDKWIKEQIVEILGMPEVYRQLPKLFELRHFESKETAEKAENLRFLLEKYAKQ
jgi:predicted nucleotidyltransferase